ncbi:molybdopterin-dependent oxidoreductase [Vampirovibrio sp.]|uniref:molybdopterin-dependent oxidoreductase n=1 Tax=Vampirovibrio sp. TaxID=2717857 RepID=UPI003592F964
MFYSLHNQTLGSVTDKPDQLGVKSNNPFPNWPASYMDGYKSVDLNQWAMEVSGLVDKPQSFSLKDFAQFTRIQQNRRLVFADGYTYRDTWEGFVVQELLHRVCPQPEAKYLKQTNLCGHVEYLPLKDLYTQRALFCVRASGKTLPAIHGGPLRLMIFDRYAHKGMGQLAKLELVEEEHPGHYACKGHDSDAMIQPGNYYASDLNSMQVIQTPGEVTQW